MGHDNKGKDYASVSTESRCPRCGKENFAFASFCIACGEPLEDGWDHVLPGEHDTAASPEEEKTRGSEEPKRAYHPQARKLLKWESVAGVFLLLCTIGYALFNWHETN